MVAIPAFGFRVVGMTDTSLPALELNTQPRFEHRLIGNEQNTVLIVDDALSNPDVLLAFAEAATFGPPPPKSRYPGLVALLPESYVKLLRWEMQQPFRSLYGVNHVAPAPVYGFFGIATVPTAEFAASQTAPHTDTVRLDSFASVHYLSQTSFGGTAFYRHKATGFEVISPIRSDKYARVRREELAKMEGQPPLAVEGLYEEIAYIEPVFNRLVLYRAGQLHRSRLNSDAALTDNPRTGRLTANLFFNTD
jgi:Family of unknown function (DUF6445)